MTHEFFCCAMICLIDRGIDSGDVLLKSKKFIVDKNSIPYDYLITTNKCYRSLNKKFVSLIKNQKIFNRTIQNEKLKTYLTRFYTDVMGAIDWRWDGKYVNSFIKGCSKPYSGAFTLLLYKKKPVKIRIFDSKFISSKKR